MLGILCVLPVLSSMPLSMTPEEAVPASIPPLRLPQAPFCASLRAPLCTRLSAHRAGWYSPTTFPSPRLQGPVFLLPSVLASSSASVFLCAFHKCLLTLQFTCPGLRMKRNTDFEVRPKSKQT